eukprot:NODE_1341_length_992_cov_176.954401_g931_i0.p2 GENE.NODE_1341_length_992_cov_176.954401_g931_i0~~NODE_1341_length_992_cov_176.954401_g931_i0.p2  ORF type:complete len:329 (-),score=95.74 NODE_1341_length_992_cov_176.954401_g931_i0:5-967(-)
MGEIVCPKSLPEFYSAFPYLDGLGFRSLADQVWDTRDFTISLAQRAFRFPLRRIFNRSLVFWSLNPRASGANSPDLVQLAQALPKIKNHFFLICHNHPHARFPDWVVQEPKILKIFSSHVPHDVTHPKVVPLPNGIFPMASKGLVGRISDARALSSVRKPTQLLANQGVGGGKRAKKFKERAMYRTHVLKILEANGFSARMNRTKLALPHYYAMLQNHSFVFSPQGTGPDAFRTWESLYLGRVPVVGRDLHPALMEGLPVLTVRKWREVTPEFLRAQWDKFSGMRFNLQRLWMPWWLFYILDTCLKVPEKKKKKKKKTLR